MKIWYLSAYDQPKGQSTRTYDFALELTQRGHQVTFFCNSYCHFTKKNIVDFDEAWKLEVIDDINIIWLKSRPYYGNGLDRGLNMLDNVRGIISSSKFLGNKPDIILGPSVPLLTGWAGSYLSRKFCVPFIFEVRDVWPDALVDIGGIKRHSLIYYIFRYIEIKMYKSATRISSTLPNLTDHVSNSNADPSKIVCIPNGIDLLQYPIIPYDGCLRRVLTVMYIGGFGLDHDVLSIIRAAKILQDEKDDRFRFILIGSGVKKDVCKREASEFNLFNLTFRDPVAKTTLPIVQNEADILIAAITDSNSFRFGLNLNKLCSYFASARPVLFAGNSPNDPVAQSGGGISVRAQDPQAIVYGLRTLADMKPSERVRLGENGRLYAQNNLSMEALGGRMEKMLESAISEYPLIFESVVK